MRSFDVPKIDYTTYSDRQLAAVPLVMLAVALLILGVWTVGFDPVGSPIQPGMDFTGGSEIQIETSASQAEISAAFTPEDQLIAVQPIQGEENNFIVSFQSFDNEQLVDRAEAAGFDVLSVRTTSPAFGSRAQQTAVFGIVLAFLGMSLLAFLLFRTFVPSIAIVVSAFSDIVIPVAAMNLLDIQLSLGTVAALLMLIGYSVDSDILLNNHVLRETGDFYESVHRAMRTGVTMTLTSLAAMIAMAIVAWFFGIQLLATIGIILSIGLAADLMNTYMLNLSLLRWYVFRGVAR